MMGFDFVLYEQDYEQIQQVLQRLKEGANAQMVLLIDRNGSMVAFQGDTERLDTTSFASLAAGNVAATESLARLLGEKEFHVLYHEGAGQNIHMSLISQRVILVVIFSNKSALGLVRLRVKQATTELERIFNHLMEKLEHDRELIGASLNQFAEITDEDIDALFGGPEGERDRSRKR